jgi:hypothetical protein
VEETGCAKRRTGGMPRQAARKSPKQQHFPKEDPWKRAVNKVRIGMAFPLESGL